ncbi:hypothetical protein JSE7799_00799 [Jannaschia seosinensis]|uniref:Flp pilus assembly protein TadB n=1 Tax=Jannaschia seosinensis TaxID=313367 RepID=A0A0M7B8F3_9RHOB|nr:hypothetical protein [Jannaschia seosinensis]CUH28099.1 hypothetical protein JSE7799_00799 [Jannaschia seosinensis]
MLRLLPLALTLGATVWALSSNPFAAPFVERSQAELTLTLERMVRSRADAEWVAAELDKAVQAEDLDRTAMLVTLARDLDRAVDVSAAKALLEARESWLAAAKTCAACMAETATCPSLTMLGSCAVPFEMSPLGDLNALRRAGTAWWDEEEIDRLDAGLALVGLGATGAVVLSGGSSLTVKAGAGMLRTARRMGSITPGMARLLDMNDAAARPVLRTVAADLGTVRTATSTAATLRLMRLVDTPEDATRLARVAEAAGPRTPRVMAVLGKSRAFRATVRLSRGAAGALVLIWLTALQAATAFATWLGGRVLRAGIDMVDRPSLRAQS